jgi:hypothetical protein
MRRRLALSAALGAAALGAAAIAACSDFADQGGGVIAIEVRTPQQSSLVVGDTVRLSARAVDREGDSVAAALVWRSADSVLGVDSASGIVVGRFPGLGRVQAFVGTLASPLVQLQVTAPPAEPETP